jgi:hypothetical protein
MFDNEPDQKDQENSLKDYTERAPLIGTLSFFANMIYNSIFVILI